MNKNHSLAHSLIQSLIQMKIAIISGSVREGRQTPKVTQALTKHLQAQPDITVELIDLAEYALPMMTERLNKLQNPKKELTTFARQVGEADAILFVTPEYHGSYSGVLKNAVDFLWKEFQRKPIGSVTVASGRMGGINASTELQLLILSLGAFPMPLKLLVPFVQNAFDPEGELIDDNLTKNLASFVSEFIWFAEAIVLHKQRTKEAMLS